MYLVAFSKKFCAENVMQNKRPYRNRSIMHVRAKTESHWLPQQHDL